MEMRDPGAGGFRSVSNNEMLAGLVSANPPRLWFQPLPWARAPVVSLRPGSGRGWVSGNVSQILVYYVDQRPAIQPSIEVVEELACEGFEPPMEVSRHMR